MSDGIEEIKERLDLDENDFEFTGGQPQDPIVKFREDEIELHLEGDAESFTVEKDGDEVSVWYNDGEFYMETEDGDVKSVKEEKEKCPALYCENWRSDCDKHDK